MARIRSLALATALTLLLPALALAAPGDFDASFDGDGIVALDWVGGRWFSLDGLASFPSTGSGYANGLARQPDGKIVAVVDSVNLAQVTKGWSSG
jgi:hypothetical protein